MEVVASVIYNDLLRITGLSIAQLERRLDLGAGHIAKAISRNSTVKQSTLVKIASEFPQEAHHRLGLETNNQGDYIKPQRSDRRDMGIDRPSRSNWMGDSYEQLHNGTWLLYSPLVQASEQPRYSSLWGDSEYLYDLPVYPIIVKETRSGGVHRSFEAPDDAMSRDSRLSIERGDIVTGYLVNRSLWKQKFDKHQQTSDGLPDFIIHHRVHGILIRNVEHHDGQSDTITCTAENPDKKLYPDLDLKLDECSEIYEVVQVTKYTA